ncbi:tyrosine-type recombinase/integrase [Brevifollis gellanilyticus]|uniref:Integrase n=1 Tax=Brevifollis gellanilyticus TaxID=748831 RepID=A0A512M8K9_9BACT|nr:site-specific integrase [Brevifollis gellanilyticus]GEP43074.1 hypothetical protein BGE01nite_23650 [Brevifollis gellanilyticus]
MASVARQKGSDFYYAFYRVPVGIGENGETRWKLLKKSTRKLKYDDAMVEAKALETNARAKAGAGDIKAKQYLRILEDAHGNALKGTLNQATATAYLSRIMEIAIGLPLVSYTIESWFREWLGYKSSINRSAGTIVRYTGVVESFLNTLSQERRASPLGTLGMNELVAFQKANKEAGKSSTTVNLAIKTLSMALNRALELGLIKTNPAKGFDKVTSSKMKKDVFEPGQVAKLRDTASGDWKGVILFGYYTGMRLGDITGLSWSNVDIQCEWLTFVDRKTSKQLQIPLHPMVTRYLKEQVRPSDNSAVFPSVHGKATSGRSGLSTSFATIMRNAGISGKQIKAGGVEGRSRNTLTFHSLRHSFTSALANAGVPAETRQKITGHLDNKTHQIYTHHDKQTLKNAVDLIPTI